VALLEGVAELVVARGRRFDSHDLRGGLPADPEALLLGRSGKLRAPTMRVGNRLLVGYNKEMYESVFGIAG